MKNIVKTYIANIVAANVAFGIIRALLFARRSLDYNAPITNRFLNVR